MKTLALAACTFAAWSLAAEASSVTGTWSWKGPNESGRWLKTIQRADGVHFQLELSRGGPSYNSGFIAGVFGLTGNKGVFRSPTLKTCVITFTFEKSRVILDQEPGSECGFGNAVAAQGDIPLESRAVPVFSKGDPRFGN